MLLELQVKIPSPQLSIGGNFSILWHNSRYCFEN